MPNTPSIVIVTRFTYRGQPEEWSNKYHFEGTQPGSDAAWKTLADALIASHKTCVPSGNQVVAAYGYEAGVKAAKFIYDLDEPPYTPVNGTLSISANSYLAPGDTAVWVRWDTGARGSTGKKIYLRKYFHGVVTTGADTLMTAQRTALLAHAAKVSDGSLPGGFKICREQGGVGGAIKVPTYVTTRTLKRRGADPS